MKTLILTICFLLLSFAADAQTGYTVSLGPTPLGNQGSCYVTPAVNTATTCTITIPANQHAYITYYSVGICGDNTANIVNEAQVSFTSVTSSAPTTALGSWAEQMSFYQATGVATTGDAVACIFKVGPGQYPLISAAGPATIVITPPAINAHASTPMTFVWYTAQ